MILTVIFGHCPSFFVENTPYFDEQGFAGGNSTTLADIVLLRKLLGQYRPTLCYCENYRLNLGQHCAIAKIISTISANIVLSRKLSAQSQPTLCYRDIYWHNLGQHCAIAKVIGIISANIVLLRKLLAQSRPTLCYYENYRHNLGRHCALLLSDTFCYLKRHPKAIGDTQ